MPPPPRRPLLFRDRGGSLSGDFDVLPEAEAFSHPLHRRSRRLVTPGGAVVARAVDHHVVELDAVRAGAIRLRLRRLLEPLQAHRGAWEIVVAVALDDVVALAITRLSSIAFMFGSSDMAPPSAASIPATTLAAKLPTAAYSTANFKNTRGLRHATRVACPPWGRRRYKSERDCLRLNSPTRRRS